MGRAVASWPKLAWAQALVWGWGQGSICLGGSARARIASCHNNLWLSSRLIDGAELAPRLMPLEPEPLPVQLDPGPSLAPGGGPHATRAPCPAALSYFPPPPCPPPRPTALLLSFDPLSLLFLASGPPGPPLGPVYSFLPLCCPSLPPQIFPDFTTLGGVPSSFLLPLHAFLP